MPTCNNPNCCLSQSSCMHVGPHSICEDHKPQRLPQIALTGWVCPVCGKGLSPFVSECSCSFGGYKITSTNG